MLDIDVFQVKISLGPVVKLLIQIAAEPSNKRMPKNQYFWDTQGHFELKGNDKLKAPTTTSFKPCGPSRNPSDSEIKVAL